MHTDFLQTLLDISRQLAENRSLDPLLDYAMEVALELFDAEYGYLILLKDGHTLDFRVRRSRDGQELDEPERQISQTILSKVIEDGQDLIIADAVSDDAFQDASSVVFLQIRSVICVPLISRGTTLGALYLENRSIAHAFTEEDLEPLKLFASQAAVAIENAALNDALEARVAERTAELQARNEELNAFAHTVAHDLKSPLTSVGGFIRLLEKKAPLTQERQQEYVYAVKRNAHKMGNIIDELLLLASVRTGTLWLEPLDMGGIIAEVQHRLVYLIDEYEAEIITPDNWPLAMGHTPWVEEVWVNYISNALKYGGRPPRIELGAEVQPDGMVRFSVSDNGAGLTPEEQSHLFQPFTQLSQVRAKGHGLGLSIVRRIVEKLGGQVGVESKVGEGSTFSFTLPRAF